MNHQPREQLKLYMLMWSIVFHVVYTLVAYLMNMDYRIVGLTLLSARE